MKTLSERMQAALKASGKSQADLARATGAKSSSVANWVGGRTKNLRGANLVNVSRLLNVSEAWLGAGVGPMERLTEGAWPFRAVTSEQWDNLPQPVREQAESYVAFLVETHAAQTIPGDPINKSTAAPLTELGSKLKDAQTRLRHNVTKDSKIDVLDSQTGSVRRRAARTSNSR
ncbi:helix-turn-helix transcriptional regulator [Achromobacter sp. Root83]|uniref:helix-turn-helix domain-containing protein n=1 Tax=Achromobacter sp. Root83 TaxID=1736602 RepID=UPI0012E3969D|nr:helix-turn-helix transcriptional regulator [Achromobacter sp. Root83]